MDLSFTYHRDRQFYALGFTPGAFGTVPFVSELRFWGVDRFPCPSMSMAAALIALKDHPVGVFTVQGVEVHPPVCTALSRHFGVEIHPAVYDTDRRDLPGGDRLIAPHRFGDPTTQGGSLEGIETLSWISLDDTAGPFGGQVRTNIDIFDLSEAEKNLIVALCCGGMDVGHIFMDNPDPGLSRLMHLVGLELTQAPETL